MPAVIMRRFRGDVNASERGQSRRNLWQQGALTCKKAEDRRSVTRSCTLDTVGVTGSIPVSPTRYKPWSDSLLVIITDRLFLRCGSILGATELDHTSHTVVVTPVRAPRLLPPPLQTGQHRVDHGLGDVGVDVAHAVQSVAEPFALQHLRHIVL